MAQDKKDGITRLTSTAFRFLSCTLFCLILTTVNATAGVKVTGNVYGGGNKADVGGSVTVNMTGGTVEGDVYGGGAKANTNINETAADSTSVTLAGGTVVGDVYGGGLGYDDEDDSKDVRADVKGNVTVTTTGGKARDVFGANNIKGSPSGVIQVNINGTAADGVRNVYGGGNQAPYEGSSTTVTMTAGKAVNVYGGGLSADVVGSVAVNIQGGTVTTDVYGGGALGHTNIGNWNGTTLASTYQTTVNLTDGSIGRNVYGGGLGRKAAAAVADNPETKDIDETAEAVEAVEAMVYGNVAVNIGAAAIAPSTEPTGNVTIGGNVFGCNNANGTPKGDVVVNVYKTAHNSNNQYPANPTLSLLTNSSDELFAIKAVYGGGNLAHYTPVASTGSDPAHSATVHVFGCSENTIKAVYGGGNAADVGTTGTGAIAANTNVIIEGGRFYTVFGGGNGAGDANPGANIYGTATTDIQGGLYNQIFGGSDSKGNVSVIALNIENLGCKLMVNESFGGANESPITGNVTTTLACGSDIQIGSFYGGSNKADITGNVTLNVEGGEYINVFGGSKGTAETPANITGDVTLNLFGGTMDNAFGGSNVNGNISGKITVNMLDKGDCPLTVHNIYGGGRDAAYTPKTPGDYPEVNLIHGTVSKKAETVGETTTYSGGNVFGGGLGATATVNSSPKVTIGYASGLSGIVNTLMPTGTTLTTAAVAVAGNVYGGGEQAPVAGSTTVTVQQGTAQGMTITTAVTGDVYGGGALADVGTAGTAGESPTPSTTHQVILTGGTVTGDVYGGGLGYIDPGQDRSKDIAAWVNGNVAVKLNENNGTAKVGGRVFGCNNLNGSPKGTVTVDVYGTYDTGTKPTKFADYLAVADADLEGHRFELAGVFGGGNLAAYDPTSGNSTTVNIYGCGTSSIKEVYGGGNAADVPGCAVNIYGAHEIGYVYGGGKGTESAAANVTGNATTTINGGTIYRTFGGSNTNGDITGTSTLTIEESNTNETCELKLGDVFSYGNRATMSKKANVTMGCLTNKVGALYGGAMNADINNDIELNVKGGSYAKVFGGNKTGGSINGSITVNIEEGSSCGIEIDDLYGCGNEAPYSIYGTEKNSSGNWVVKTSGTAQEDPTINLRSFTRIGNVYGGGLGESAVVLGTPTVNVNVTKASGYTLGNVYGGGSMASVTGNTIINIGTTSTTPMATVTDDPATSDVNEGSPSVASAAISGDVFGGGYGHETNVSGTATINIGERSGTEGSYTYTDHGASFSNTSNIYGGSALGTVVTTVVNLYAGTIAANVFGGGKGYVDTADDTKNVAATVTTANVNLCDATVTGNIYGGCNDNGTTTTAIVNLIGGTIGTDGTEADKVFGGGKGHETTTTTATVNVGSDTATGSSTIYSNVYGGSALGAVGTANVVLNKATALKGDVFGGGMGDDSNAATATTPTVSLNGDVHLTVTGSGDTAFGGNIYGGCNVNGSVSGKATVNLTGGSVPANVFGGGKGNNTSFTSDGSVEVNVGNYDGSSLTGATTISGDVYGGSALGTVYSPVVNLWAGTVEGDVYGGGLGDNAHAAAVNGNVRVNLNGNDTYATGVGSCVVKRNIFGGNNANGSPTGKAEVHIYKTAGYTPDHERTALANLSSATEADHHYELAAVYGGGNLAAFTGTTTEVVIETCDPSIETVYGGGNAADATNTSVLVKGAYEIGTVFGGGNGEVTPANVSGTATTVLNGGFIHDFYGGSNSQGTIGTYNETTHETTGGPVITINDLKIGTDCSLRFDNIYGAGKNANVDGDINMTMGCLSDEFTVQNLYGGAKAANVRGNVTLTVTSGQFENVFGGNDQSGTIGGNITVNVEETGCQPLKIANVYGGGNLAPYTGNPTVNLKSFTSVGNVYGGGLGTTAVVTGNPTVNINQTYGAFTTDTLGVITGNVYGGGSEADVTGNTSVNIGTLATVQMASQNNQANTVVGTKILGNVFGGGYGVSTNVSGNVEVIVGQTNINVISDSIRIKGDVYGGSALGTVNGESADASKHTHVTLNKGRVTGSVYGGGLGDADHAATVNGAVEVTVNGGKAANVFGCNNVNGSPQSTVKVYINGTAADVTLGTAAIGNVYGGGNLAVYTYKDNAHPLLVEINQNPSATDCIIGNVYGGGLSADVEGSITVNVKGGRVLNDVYGGGALANTNTANWNGSALTADGYYKVTGITAGSSFIKGLYTKSGNTYTLITDKDLKASTETDYYRYGTTYNTTVNLTGGIVGNAYGGGLGRLAADAVGNPEETGYIAAVSAVEANVYGDVSVNVNGTGFTAQNDKYTEYWYKNGSGNYVKKELDNAAYVPKTGRVFGCNNLNGTPKGNVKVEVRRTRKLNELGTAIIDGHETNKYEIRGVYGGGNMADYLPATGKATALEVHNCEETMIEKVYGGGNSASVPTTDVTIYGAREIHYVFGGGNGADVVWKNGRWQENDGANVTGNARVVLKGGTISDAFIGSDTKGTIQNADAEVVTETGGDCNLKLTNLYGSSRRADVFGDVDIKISACSQDDIENIYGGSYDAQIHGRIKMTVTSGILKNVFGGNDRLGSIGGDIEMNIEEADECKPIIIQNLYGGGFNAPYPGEGASRITNEYLGVDSDGKPLYKDAVRDAQGNWSGLVFADVLRGKITINIKSCTRIDNIYGGGFGENAVVTGETEVNVNMKKGAWVNKDLPDLTEYPGQTPPNIENNKIKDEIGTIGNIYGGGNQGAVAGIATINIGTESTIQHLVCTGSEVVTENGKQVTKNTYETQNFPVEGAHITGNVYGGGYLADVTKEVTGKNAQNKPTYRDGTGRTYINICAVETSPNTFNAVSNGTVTIEGHVYGGGRGLADDFYCRQGMVGVENENDGTPRENEGTNIRIGNGTIEKNVYGGGEVGRVEWNSYVTIGLTPASGVTSAPKILGNVFGGGKGASTHGYSALLRGDTHVTIQANAKVRNSVYGGGEIASVGRYNVATDNATAAQYGVGIGMPYSLANAKTGQCFVTVQGNAEIGPDAAMTMPTFYGNVFGGGKGVLPYEGYADNENPWRMPPSNDKQYYTSSQKEAYLKYVETLALATRTYVTIDGSAFVKGSVYGGSENGIVQQNTLVKIKGGQIGCGEGETTAYSSGWINPLTETITPLKECAHWPYGLDTDNDGKKDLFAPYDKFADADGKYEDGTSADEGRPTASDGHTFYGNVFGGGCGKDPYRPGEWHNTAGAVRGNTKIEITGGHILTNVYGGNEMTNVGNDGVDTTGVCTIKMTGGTIGVPRTLDEIAAHPVTCYLFGGCKGDQRVLFNKETNVKDAIVEITGGTIYGSVFGGGEDGHVMRNVEMTIGDNNGGPIIGTWGTSYVDGNVFGGGRGYSGEALTAGNVGGGIDLKIKGGTMLGSIYGGGRLASVGYGLYDEGVEGYGRMRDDDKMDNGSDGTTFFTKGRGHVEIEISGGTIGNSHEYVYFTPGTTAEQLASGKANMPDTEFELVKDADNSVYRLKHTKGGNVFAGGMGRMYLMDGTTPISNVDWWRLGNVKSTKLTISGGTIKSNVYGGSELGWVTGTHGAKDAQNNDINVSTEIIITGGTIGTEILDGSSNPKYTFGSVYGGGYGSTVEKLHSTDDPDTNYDNPKFTAGRVVNSTKVSMSGGTVKASVYGGGEVANVGMFSSFGETPITGSGNTHIIISGGTIGKEGFGGATMGNVYGGGNGNRSIVRCGLVYGNTNVNISGTPTIYHNIYGGGAYGTVGDFDYEKKTDTELGVVKVYGIDHLVTPGTGVANVTITGGTFGIDGHNNGMVFGSSRGDVTDPALRDDYMAWVYDTHVTIGTAGGNTTTPLICGSVYGSGENGHTFHDTDVKMHSGTVGITDTSIDGGAAYPYRGNVYGGGCGTDTYTYNNEEHYKPMAGIVLGNTSVEIDGGLVVHNVYGAGSMGSVGKVDTDNAHTIISGGKATITVSGGTIGVDGNENGNVFGAARGDATITQDSLALAKTTIVTISTDADVKGSVFGGGEAGLVQDSTKVSMTGGNVAQNIYGGGYLGNVGIIDKRDPNNYKWTDSQGAYNKTGVCTVEVTGGTVGPDNNTDPKKGNVFGAGKGSAETFRCENAMAYNAFVTVSNGEVNGNVYGGGEIGRVENNTKVKIGEEDGTDEFTITGSVFGAGAGVESHGYSALVRGNTTVTIQGKAHVGKNVYGGGEIASVGRYGLNAVKMPNILLDGGDCQVIVKDNARITGDVYGASKGVDPHFDNNNTNHSKRSRRMVTPSARYTNDNKATWTSTDNDKDFIWEYSDATEQYIWEYYMNESDYLSYLETLALATAPDVTITGNATVSGSVFGGGEMGLTKGSVSVNILGGTITKDVYGGGALASSNTTNEVGIKVGNGYQMDADNNYVTTIVHPTTTVTLSGGVINGDAYGGALGRKASDTETAVAPEINGDITVKLNEGKTGTNTGCVVNRVFGCNNLNGTPRAHVTVHVYATQHKDKSTITSKFNPPSYDPDYNTLEITETYHDYLQRVINAAYTDGDPSKAILPGVNESVVNAAKVVLNKTGATDTEYSNAAKSVNQAIAYLYDVQAVYGGGNLAMYEPADPTPNATPNETTEQAEVIIDGCQLTCIKQVYGSGNAASTPATSVTVNGTYVIDEVFGGGNGADNYQVNGVWYENPGANVGYYDYTRPVTETDKDTNGNLIGTGSGTAGDPYKCIEKDDADTKEERQGAGSPYVYGTGITNTLIRGGTVHRVYGGSNRKGNIRTEAKSAAEASGDCDLHVGQVYGAGKSAPIDGNVNQDVKCASGVEEIFGGSKNSDVNSDIYLKITNGSSLKRVFGGNNTSGKVNGSITVEVEEGGCEPIHIQELYAGGYLAAYSVYGYKNEGTAAAPNWQPRTKADWEAMTAEEKTAEGLETPRKDPRINVISATRIDNIFGGGYQALVIGNPHVNVNMTNGKVVVEKKEKTVGDAATYSFEEGGKTYVYKDAFGTIYDNSKVNPTDLSYELPLGTIGYIYGGGNLANIYGNTYVEIGTGEWLNKDDEREMLGTSPSDGVTEATTFTYKKISDSVWKWTYDKPTTVDEPITGTITPDQGGVPASPSAGETVTGTCTADGITTSTTFTYKDGHWTYEKTTTTPASIDGTPTPSRYDATIDGHVFGGGKGQADTFTCEKAMVGEDGKGVNADFTDNVNYKDGNTNVIIANGTVKRTIKDGKVVGGNVYGGGEIARVEKNTTVTIGLGDGVAPGSTPTSAPVIEGDVFGAGSGIETHGYSALVRGNPTVTIQGNAQVRGSVYGGGEIASVARYKVPTTQAEVNAAIAQGYDAVLNSPYALANSTSGNCKVTIRGYAEIGPDGMQMKKFDSSDNPLPPDDKGHVFGAGKGFLPKVYSYADNDHKPKRMSNVNGPNTWEYFGNDTDYHKFIETLALSSQTDVTISDHAFVKGSVYGGSENGIVQFNTHVTIEGDCQIGCGAGKTEPYSEALWTQAKAAATATDIETIATQMPECAHWDYTSKSAPYDPYAKADGKYDYTGEYSVIPEEKQRSSTDGGKLTATDGHTYYGNVFGGGSGVIPYAPGLWHRSAGLVRGNTVVDITGGHILTNVYGGNEHTDVGTYTPDANNNNDPIIPKSGGKCTVNMVGGTLGLPRTPSQMVAHPLTGYLFGSGKGDKRIFFNTWTNVTETDVNITGDARIFGSVFGGGEDGHIINDAKTTVGGSVSIDRNGDGDTTDSNETFTAQKGLIIGTTGTSYVDGNIFGAGRGFSGEALTAGSVGGNVTVNIKGGTMLGSVYGGGRLASVGTFFTSATDPYYGQLKEDVADDPSTTDVDETNTHGHITINISGGTIGNDLENVTVEHPKGGNVFGGSMGRLKNLDGETTNPLWPKMGTVKTTKINIYGDALIKSKVYGGGEYGMTRGDAHVTVGGILGDDNETITSNDTDKPIIKRDVFGGGYGSDDYTTETKITAGGFDVATYTFTPMQLAGIVCGDTYVNIKRGHVQKNVYGGGELATVGLINFNYAEKHANIEGSGTTEKIYGFGLSWPYKMDFIPYMPDGTGPIGGTTNINVTGGRLGITGKDVMIAGGDKIDNGDIYGGSKGKAGDRYDMAFCGNVKATNITIDYPSDNGAKPENYKDQNNDGSYKYDCIAGAVYGGGEDGHVIEDTHVTLKNGLIGHSLYGGGSGKGKFEQELNMIGSTEKHDVEIYSITAGKVYGDTHVKMEGGYVVRNIYGGGNMGSVGKGNYAGAKDDFSWYADGTYNGYGEKLVNDSLLWTPNNYDPSQPISESNKPNNAWHFLNSGKTEVEISGGTIGYIDDNPEMSTKDGLPYGNVFGGCRGESAPNIGESPRYHYSPEFFSGYVNETKVIIGDSTNTADDYTGPTILGSVYGGGQDGHVRRDTRVVVYNGEIGLVYNEENKGKLHTDDINDTQWLTRGNVFGAGSGIGKYQFDFDNDGKFETKNVSYTNPQTGRTSLVNETDYSTSAGSVTRFTKVEVKGGKIHRNVYGGGSMASVGPPKIPPTRTDGDGFHPDDEAHKDDVGRQTLNEVIIGGRKVAGKVVLTYIGDSISYAAGYGGNVFGASRGDLSIGDSYGTSIWTKVFIKDGSNILGNVFGGGDNGMVKQDSEVIIGEAKAETTPGQGQGQEPGQGD